MFPVTQHPLMGGEVLVAPRVVFLPFARRRLYVEHHYLVADRCSKSGRRQSR